MFKINLFAKSFLMMACMAVTFTSCPDDDEDESNSNDGSKKEEKKNQDSNKEEDPKNDSGDKENGGEGNEETSKHEVSVNGVIEGHKYVDLGLPSGLKWAICNVGANEPDETGNYFGWGEVVQQESYEFEKYSMFLRRYGFDTQYTKYVESYANGTPDSLTVLEPCDDAATYNWGGSWRMPKKSEFEELINNCTWEWVDNFNGSEYHGMMGTSKHNGHTIMLLAAGFWVGSKPSLESANCCYWTSVLTPNKDSGMAYSYDITDYGKNRGFYTPNRYKGHSVRAVSK